MRRCLKPPQTDDCQPAGIDEPPSTASSITGFLCPEIEDAEAEAEEEKEVASPLNLTAGAVKEPVRDRRVKHKVEVKGSRI